MGLFLKIFASFALMLVLASCDAQPKSQYDKSAVFWYNKMLSQISLYRLDDADNTFISLESEHRSSPLISSALMILASAHMKNEEYELANFYLDEYIKRFARDSDIEYVRYLKLKAKFLAFKSEYREQALIDNTLKSINKYVKQYPSSPYIFLAKDMQTRLYMARIMFDKNIAGLYGRIDKPKAKKFYLNKMKENFIKVKDIKKVDVPWYRAIFE